MQSTLKAKMLKFRLWYFAVIFILTPSDFGLHQATSVMIPNRREVYSTIIVVRTESSQLSLTLYVAVMRLLPYGSRVHLGGFCNYSRLVERIAKGGVLNNFSHLVVALTKWLFVVLFRATSLNVFQQSFGCATNLDMLQSFFSRFAVAKVRTFPDMAKYFFNFLQLADCQEHFFQ